MCVVTCEGPACAAALCWRACAIAPWSSVSQLFWRRAGRAGAAPPAPLVASRGGGSGGGSMWSLMLSFEIDSVSWPSVGSVGATWQCFRWHRLRTSSDTDTRAANTAAAANERAAPAHVAVRAAQQHTRGSVHWNVSLVLGIGSIFTNEPIEDRLHNRLMGRHFRKFPHMDGGTRELYQPTLY